eukprot:ANDGO_02250.mRNA.1 Calmodulin
MFTKKDIDEAFRAMDKDGNGYISALDLRLFFAALGEKLDDHEIDMMISELDVDGDGQVGLDEFARLASQKTRKG